jgi:hypothetical protein
VLDSDYSEYLITNAARRASFVTPNGVPQQVKDYTSWQRLEPDPELRVQLLQQTRPVVEVLESSPSVATVIASLNAVESLRIRRHQRPLRSRCPIAVAVNHPLL